MLLMQSIFFLSLSVENANVELTLAKISLIKIRKKGVSSTKIINGYLYIHDVSCIDNAIEMIKQIAKK